MKRIHQTIFGLVWFLLAPLLASGTSSPSQIDSLSQHSVYQEIQHHRLHVAYLTTEIAKIQTGKLPDVSISEINRRVSLIENRLDYFQEITTDGTLKSSSDYSLNQSLTIQETTYKMGAELSLLQVALFSGKSISDKKYQKILEDSQAKINEVQTEVIAFSETYNVDFPFLDSKLLPVAAGKELPQMLDGVEPIAENTNDAWAPVTPIASEETTEATVTETNKEIPQELLDKGVTTKNVTPEPEMPPAVQPKTAEEREAEIQKIMEEISGTSDTPTSDEPSTSEPDVKTQSLEEIIAELESKSSVPKIDTAVEDPPSENPVVDEKVETSKEISTEISQPKTEKSESKVTVTDVLNEIFPEDSPEKEEIAEASPVAEPVQEVKPVAKTTIEEKVTEEIVEKPAVQLEEPQEEVVKNQINEVSPSPIEEPKPEPIPFETNEEVITEVLKQESMPPSLKVLEDEDLVAVDPMLDNEPAPTPEPVVPNPPETPKEVKPTPQEEAIAITPTKPTNDPSPQPEPEVASTPPTTQPEAVVYPDKRIRRIGITSENPAEESVEGETPVAKPTEPKKPKVNPIPAEFFFYESEVNRLKGQITKIKAINYANQEAKEKNAEPILTRFERIRQRMSERELNTETQTLVDKLNAEMDAAKANIQSFLAMPVVNSSIAATNAAEDKVKKTDTPILNRIPENRPLRYLALGNEKWYFFFDTGQTDLRSNQVLQLDHVVKMLEYNPEVGIKVTGYADKTGNADKNQALSDRRASVVKSYFESKGISPSRINVTSFGESKAARANDPFSRRVEVKIQMIQ